MFRTLYADVHIVYGGLFYDPDKGEAIEVVDLDSAAGVSGCNLIERGEIYAAPRDIQSALRSAGQEDRLDEVLAAANALKMKGSFDALTNAQQAAILIGASAVHGYSGFDDSPDVILVANKADVQPKRGESVAECIERLRDEWHADRTIVTKNPERAIWKTLRTMGVRKTS
jgi:hypothetical protein